MASKRKYAYYLKGNKVAIIEENIGGGVCSLSGYSNQTTCESAGGTWTENAFSNEDNQYKSPVLSVDDGLEIQYSYSPTYRFPVIDVDGDTPAKRTKFFLNGWIIHEGYLTLVRASSTGWTNFSNVDVGDYIYIGGSDRWNGIHKIQEIESIGATTHGGIKTYTKVQSTPDVNYVFDDSVNWTISETITLINSATISDAFTDSTTTPYLWINGSNDDDSNNGLFSGWTSSGTTLTLSAGKRYSFSTSEIEESEGTPACSASTSKDLHVYRAYREPFSYFITDIEVLQDETFEIDLTRYQANAVVYYLKAKLAEDSGDFDKREFYLREFKKQLEKGSSAFKRGPYIVQGFKGMLK